MNHFEELITHRRSIRHYTEDQLLPSEVQKIMKAALMAPSSKNSCPWQFILVENKEMLRKLAQCKSSGAAFIEGAALAVVVLSDPLRSSAYIEDASIAATYIQLQAEDLGLGSCWIQIKGRETTEGYDSEQYVRDLFHIPLQLVVGCVIAVGHKARTGKPHDEEKLPWEKLHIESYQYESPEQ